MNRDLCGLEWGVVVDVVHVGQRQDAGVTASADQAASRLSGMEVSLEQLRRQSSRPLIEVAEHETRCNVARVVVHDLEQLLRLVAPLEVTRSQMHIEDSQPVRG